MKASCIDRQLVLGICIALSLPCSRPSAAEKAGGSDESPGSSAVTEKPQAYLGIGVASLAPAVAAHAGEALAEGQGVLVIDVLVGSPAAKAGIKANDILATYGDQKLYSPEQLVKLIHHGQPGETIAIGVVHRGKLHTVKVMLTEHPQIAPEVALKPRPWLSLPWFDHSHQSANDQAAKWGTFDALTLTRIDEQNFKAEIRFRDDEGKVETHTFEGTREQIRKAVEAQKHLPETERRHLLRSLALPDGTGIPGLRMLPDGEIIFDFREMER